MKTKIIKIDNSIENILKSKYLPPPIVLHILSYFDFIIIKNKLRKDLISNRILIYLEGNIFFTDKISIKNIFGRFGIKPYYRICMLWNTIRLRLKKWIELDELEIKKDFNDFKFLKNKYEKFRYSISYRQSEKLFKCIENIYSPEKLEVYTYNFFNGMSYYFDNYDKNFLFYLRNVVIEAL